MPAGGDRTEKLELVTNREDVLRRLRDAPVHKRDLAEELDHSRSTLDRAVRKLEDRDLVERRDGGYVATAAGRLALDHLDSFRETFADLVDAEAVLAPLPPGAPITPEAVAGSEAALATEPAPYRPLERVHDELAGADRYRAVVPTLDDPRHVRLLYEHVVTDDRPAELVVSPSVFETFREEYPRRMAALADHDAFRLFVADDTPTFAFGLIGDGPETTVPVIVFTDSGTVHGTLVNDAPAAVRWATDQFERLRSAATERTADLGPAVGDGAPDTDGGVTLARSLPLALERAGFVRVDGDYFRDEPVADPVTAWRAGLSLAEVHTGYAVDRQAGGEDDGTLAERLEEHLAEGVDCAVVGPPGAGKSTLCKQVACAWYAADRGPVLYRASGRGRSFSSVDVLVERVTNAEGHALVVVEDAAGPDASAVFEAVRRLADREDVSVLLDSRESEWHDPPEGVTVPDVRLLYAPTIDETDCERLVAHFERTLGEDVDVPVERLWEGVSEEVRAADTTASGMLLVLHRLASYADPLGRDRTTLEAEASSLVASLADDDLALRVGTLVNLLNAAGIGVDRDAPFAVADPGEFDAVEAAIERLEGRVLFGDGDRTVHESWSVTFLAQLPDVVGEETARELVGEALSRYLALADDARRRVAIVSHLDEAPTVAAVETDPAAWAGETVDQFGDLAGKRPKLAPLFDDGEAASFSFPDRCPEGTRRQWPARLGEALFDGSYYDRAERAYERLGDAPRDDAERTIGLARVANAQGNYETAIERAESVFEEPAPVDDALVARARLVFGTAAVRVGEYERADEQLRRAIDRFERIDDRTRLAKAWLFRGNVAYYQREFDRARDRYGESLATARETGDREAEAGALNNLGSAIEKLGEYDRAREHYEESLAIRRETGNRKGVGEALGNLALLAFNRGDYETAREYDEESLAIARDLGDRQGTSTSLNNLGILAATRGNLERARECFEESLAIDLEIGDRMRAASAYDNLARVARREGNFDDAREYYEEEIALWREQDNGRNVAETLEHLGEISMVLGDYGSAREYFEEALELRREQGEKYWEASLRDHLGELARRTGDLERAREHFEASTDLVRECDDESERARTLCRRGELARMQSEFATARRHFESAAERADELDPGRVALGRGRLELALDDPDEARERAESARETFAELNSDPWIARSDRLLGRAAAAAGDGERTREHLTDALEAFAGMGATVDELATLLALVETGETERTDRLESVLERAPDGVVERYRDRLDDVLDGEF